jgi:hypothetical protein
LLFLAESDPVLSPPPDPRHRKISHHHPPLLNLHPNSENNQKKPRSKKVAKFAYKQSLPLGFLVAIAVGMAWPQPGQAVAHYTVNGWKVATTINMSIIFFIFGVTLDARELSEAARAARALSLGVASILFLTPLTGLLAARLPFNPKEFALGLAVMSCAPTSLSSGVTLVGQGYGSGALALLLTVSTNVLGIATSPLMVKLALKGAISSASGGGGARVDSGDLLVKLGTSILAPLVFGKALREGLPAPFRRVWVPKCKPGLYLTNNLQVRSHDGWRGFCLVEEEEEEGGCEREEEHLPPASLAPPNARNRPPPAKPREKKKKKKKKTQTDRPHRLAKDQRRPPHAHRARGRRRRFSRFGGDRLAFPAACDQLAGLQGGPLARERAKGGRHHGLAKKPPDRGRDHLVLRPVLRG